MFIPNTVIQTYRRGATNKFGESALVSTGSVMGAVLRINHTRAANDTAGSDAQGFAHERAVDAAFLLAPTASVRVGDAVGLSGAEYQINSIVPRHDLLGTLDHYEVECQRWPD